MEVVIDKNAIQGLADEIIEAGLIVAGEIVKTSAIQNLQDRPGFEGKGFLEGQIDSEIIMNEKKVRISANTEYAAIQEFGGDIKPRNVKALTIPLNKEAQGKRAKDFPDLFLIKIHNKAFLVRKKGKQLQFMYLLRDQVHIPARPYLAPAVYNNLDKIIQGFANAAR
jgi:phage gpG-like protein